MLGQRQKLVFRQNSFPLFSTPNKTTLVTNSRQTIQKVALTRDGPTKYAVFAFPILEKPVIRFTYGHFHWAEV